jgi:hypothetical protein
MEPSATTQKIVSELKNVIQRAKGRLTPSDATSATGYSIEEAKDGLTRLIELYECRVSMDSHTGDLQFIFNYPLKQKGSKNVKEITLDALHFLWTVFKVIYKAAIGIILIFYTVVFIIILLAIIFGGAGRDRGKGSQGASILAGLFRAIFEGMRLATWIGTVEYMSDSGGYHYKQYQPEKNKGKKFIQSVYHFVFGPERPEYNPLADAREAVAFIKRNKGKLTAGQIVALTGVDYDEAERRLADYAVKYKGELYINDNGVVVAEFNEILQRANPLLEESTIEFYIDEIDPPFVLTGNTASRNAVIILMNSFNLLMSIIAINYFSFNLDSQPYAYILGYFPLVFSILFFLIPLFRIPYITYKKQQREKSVMRKKLVSGFISTPDETMTFDNILKKGRIDENLSNFAQKIMDSLVLQLQGQIVLRDDGTAVYTFPRLSKELLV